MKIIQPSHEIIHLHNLKDILKTIELAGRTCYKSEDRITGDSAAGFVRRIIKSGHHSVIEHMGFTVRFICDRGVSHEIVRHRLASFSQESTRYVNYGGKHMEFIRPCWLPDLPLGEYTSFETDTSDMGKTTFLRAMLEAESWYNRMLDLGWRPEMARCVLPNSLKTEIVMTANLREWRHVLKLRCQKAAHPQMRELMMPLLNELKRLLPVVFEDIKGE